MDKVTNYQCLSKPMRALVDHVIYNAVDLSSDMRLDLDKDEVEALTIKEIRTMVFMNAVVFFGQELDQDSGVDDEQIPAYIRQAINERVDSMDVVDLLRN
jgi:hypothetical protein